MLYKSRIIFLWPGDDIALTEVDIATATALQQIFNS